MDHAGMDHGTMHHDTMNHEAMNHDAHMNPAAMDHEAGSQVNPHSMMMAMSFHGGCNEVILFDFWKVSTVAGLVSWRSSCYV